MTNHVKRKYSDEYLAEIVQKSRNMSDVFRALDMQRNGTTYRHVKNRIENAGINTAHFLGLRSRLGQVAHNRISADEILILRLSKERQPANKLRRALAEIGREYICEKCGNTGTWMGEPVQLEIDHINRNRADDRRENLRFLCPMCHSQESRLFHGVRIQAVKKRCEVCGKGICAKSKHCHKHKPLSRGLRNRQQQCKIEWPSLDVLLEAKRNRKVFSLAKVLGVSDVAIHKRIRRFTRS